MINILNSITNNGTPINGVDQNNKELLEKFNKSLIDLSNPPEFNPVCIYYNDQPFVTLGNIIGIKGQQGARKTFFVSGIVASWLSKKDILGFKATPDIDKKAVFWVDTEQSEDDVYNCLQRVAKMCKYERTDIYKTKINKNPDDIYLASMRRYDPKTILSILKYIVKEKAKELNLGLIIIDGLSDLLETSVNDEKASNELVRELMTLSEQYKLLIAFVIHENIGNSAMTGGKARGHLGSEAERKSQAMIAIKKNKDKANVSDIEITKARRIQPDEKFISFWVDDGFLVPDNGDTPAQFGEDDKTAQVWDALKDELLKMENNTLPQKEVINFICGFLKVKERKANDYLDLIRSDFSREINTFKIKNANYIKLVNDELPI